MSTTAATRGRKRSSVAPPPPVVVLSPEKKESENQTPKETPTSKPRPNRPPEKCLSAVSPPGFESETCKTFVFRKEGHTLGNSLRNIITHYPDVEFCGYSLPHPAEDVMHFRIQSIGTPALEVLSRGFEDLSSVCDEIERQFEEAMANYVPEDEPERVVDLVDLEPDAISEATFLKPQPPP